MAHYEFDSFCLRNLFSWEISVEMLDQYLGQDVLNNPDSTRTKLSRGGVEYRLPNGQGVRFNVDGSLSGFLDPRR